MLTDLNPAVSLPRRQQETPKQGADLLKHLRLIVRQHQICYEIWPIWSTAEGISIQTGFELLLCGVNGHPISDGGGLHAVPCCQHCAQTYSKLREIAEWIRQLQLQPSRYNIHSFDCALHMAPPHRHYRSEIVISATIFNPDNPNPADYRCEGKCLKEVRKGLSKLGIQEDVVYPPISGNAPR